MKDWNLFERLAVIAKLAPELQDIVSSMPMSREGQLRAYRLAGNIRIIATQDITFLRANEDTLLEGLKE